MGVRLSGFGVEDLAVLVGQAKGWDGVADGEGMVAGGLAAGDG